MSPILSPENPSGTWVLLSLFRPESFWAASLRASKERGTGCWRHSVNCPLSAHHSFPSVLSPSTPGCLAWGCQSQTLQEGEQLYLFPPTRNPCMLGQERMTFLAAGHSTVCPLSLSPTFLPQALNRTLIRDSGAPLISHS